MDINTPEGMRRAQAWMTQLIATLNDGGVWAVPRSGTIITFDKTNKRVSIVQLEPDISIEMVLEAMGWEITYKK